MIDTGRVMPQRPALPLLTVTILLLLAPLAFADDLALAEQMLNDGWCHDADSLLARLHAEQPDNPEVLRLLGIAALYDDDYETALELGDKAIALDGTNYRYPLFLSNAWGVKARMGGKIPALGRAKKSKRYMQQARELAPNEVDPCFALMQYNIQAPGIAGGDKDDARAYADTIAALDPLMGYYCKSVIAESVDDNIEMAEAYLLEARQYSPDTTMTHFWLASFYGRHDKLDEIKEVLDKMAVRWPDNGTIFMSLGYLYQELQQYDSAFAAFEKVLAIDPDHALARYQLGRNAVFAKTRLAEGEAQFRKYLDAHRRCTWPGEAATFWRLAMLKELQGDLESAVDLFGRAYQMEPSSEQYKDDWKAANKRLKKSR